jgi:acetyltransferase
MCGDPEGPQVLRAAGIPCYEDPLRALKALRALVVQGKIAAVPREAEPAARAPEEAAARLSAAATSETCVLSENAAREVLAGAGVPVARGLLAQDAGAAVAAAAEIGYPVALKVDSPDIPHKTEAGGVALDLATPEAVRDGFDAILARARTFAPDARIEGVGVHEMVTGGVELILGIKRDPAFGPVVMLGAGGELVEVMKDTVLRVAPLSRREAEAMIDELACLPLLTGVRGRPRADLNALVDAILRVSALAMAAPGLAELDINPLMVLPVGEGVRAADALITVAPSKL